MHQIATVRTITDGRTDKTHLFNNCATENELYLFSCCQLKRINDTNNFIKISSSGGRIQDGQLQPLVRTNNEHSSGGQGDAGGVLLVRVQHAVQGGDVAVRVRNDGVGELCEVVVGQDVVDPATVGLGRVAGQSRQLYATLSELL